MASKRIILPDAEFHKAPYKKDEHNYLFKTFPFDFEAVGLILKVLKPHNKPVLDYLAKRVLHVLDPN